MRMVDADALGERLKDLDDWCRDLRKHGIEQARSMVHEAPTIDAVPVVHAYWRFRKVREGNHQYICSNCNDSFGFRGDEYDLPKQSFVRKDYRFCRNCGARMDAEKEEPT